MDYQEAIYCMKVMADEEVCEECNYYQSCDHTKQADMARIVIFAMNELQQYKQIGTMEKVREAVEKQKAVKPLYRHYEDKGNPSYIKITCPNGCNIQLYPVTDKHFAHEHVYCPKCGQKIDWSDEE